jgi:signal transduction histidine kinase
MQTSGVIDLKLRLALQVVALSGFCFLAASAYVVLESGWAAQARARAIAGLLAKGLELQQNQLHWVKPAINPFPDLERIATPLMAPGLCMAYKSKDGETVERLCSGVQSDEMAAPVLFAKLYRSVFHPGQEVTHPVLFGNKIEGIAAVTLDPGSLIAQSWRETSQLLAIMAVTLVALCALVYFALARALRSTKIVVAGLERLAANDLSTRLPPFDLAELSAIGNVFNTLAAALQSALAERNTLTKRLIQVQDEERRHLARELHDEFGQCLAAIAAVAASAGETAKAECTALVPQCQRIAQTVAQMMETLRGTLFRLRAPDVEEFGLITSLQSLVAGWNSGSRGRTHFELGISNSFEGLPAHFGTNLYRIAQEAITNAAKHAEATRIWLNLCMRKADAASPHPSAYEIELTVTDDGKASPPDLTAKSGMGLLGMRERVVALGGRLSFEPQGHAGSILRAVIPAPQITVSEV